MENSCPLGWPYVLIIFCLLVFLCILYFGFNKGVMFLIAPVPIHFFSVT